MWSSVASAGAVDTADIGKIVFAKSVAQLGEGGGVVNRPVGAGVAERLALPTISAAIRYPVRESDLGSQAVGVWGLTVRYRDGDGGVNVQVIEVAMVNGAEKLLVQLQSGVGYNRSNEFHMENTQGTFGLDFRANVYYVLVTLSASETIRIGTPPAVQLMQIDSA